MVKLSIVIPVYNEEEKIKNTLNKCLKYLKSNNWDFEFIVVNDGSKDGTSRIVKNFKKVKLIEHKPNRGKGYSVREGMLNAKGDYILFLDADLSTPIEELNKMIKYSDKYDVVIASRAVSESNVKALHYRKILGRAFAFLVNILLVSGIHDTQCGFKLFSKKATRDIFSKQTVNGWAFDVEVLFLARKFGYKIKEVGVNWQHFDHAAAGNVTPAKQSFKMLKEILKIRWNSIRGIYN